MLLTRGEAGTAHQALLEHQHPTFLRREQQNNRRAATNQSLEQTITGKGLQSDNNSKGKATKLGGSGINQLNPQENPFAPQRIQLQQQSALGTSRRLLQDTSTNGKALSISSSTISLAAGQLASPYRADLDQAYTYTNATGLPGGLQLRNGSIVGLPKVTGTFNISLTAVAKGKSSKQNYSLTIRGMELVVSGGSEIYRNTTTQLILIIRGGVAPIKLAIESGPAYCTLKDYKLVCTPSEVGSFAIKFLLTDKAGNTVYDTINLNCIVDPKQAAKSFEVSSSKAISGNINAAHNAVLQTLQSKCVVTEKEYYSGVQIVATMSIVNQELTLVGGTVVVLQNCTTKQFVSTIQGREFQSGSKVVFAGIPNNKPNQYLATKVLKIRDP